MHFAHLTLSTAVLRYDKYEKKTKYWCEEDLEMEWEKEESKERVEESGYDAELPAPPGLDHADPMLPNMSLAARGPRYSVKGC